MIFQFKIQFVTQNQNRYNPLCSKFKSQLCVATALKKERNSNFSETNPFIFYEIINWWPVSNTYSKEFTLNIVKLLPL